MQASAEEPGIEAIPSVQQGNIRSTDFDRKVSKGHPD